MTGYDIVRRNPPSETFFETDEDFRRGYEQAQVATQMKANDNLLRRQRHYTLYYLLRQVDVQKGNVAECGCLRGLSAYQTASYLKEKNFKNKFYLFDSFEGLSEFDQADLAGTTIKNVDEKRKHFACPMEETQSNLKEFEFIVYKKGWIPQRFPEVAQEKFIFVHIDVDLYRPIKDSLEFFYPRVVAGGVIAFDDYGCSAFPGAKQAVDEFMRGKNDFFLALPSGHAFILKGQTVNR